MANRGLTLANFVDIIKNMGERERKKLTAEELIDLIIQIPDAPATNELAELRAAIDHLTKISSVNQTEILALKTSNDDLVKKHTSLNLEITLLKTQAHECKDRQQNPEPAKIYLLLPQTTI